MTAAIDQLTDLIRLTDVPDYFPRRRKGRKISLVTLWRWSRDGCGPARVKFPVRKIGGVAYVSRAELMRFIEKVSGAKCSTVSPATLRQRERAHERATAELDEMLA